MLPVFERVQNTFCLFFCVITVSIALTQESSTFFGFFDTQVLSNVSFGEY